MKRSKVIQPGLDGESGLHRFPKSVSSRVLRPGEMLVEWLNSHHQSEGAKRICDVIQKIKRLQNLENMQSATLRAYLKREMPRGRKVRDERPGTSWDSYEFYLAEHDAMMMRFGSNPVFTEMRRLEMQINRELDNYSFLPRLHVSAGAPRVAWIPPSERRRDPVWSKLAMLLSLAERGQLDSIGFCERCGRWFCSRRRRFQRFCSSKCQQVHYKLDPEWKARRAQYMRRYRLTAGEGGN
jgi:hypothetical protein